MKPERVNTQIDVPNVFDIKVAWNANISLMCVCFQTKRHTMSEDQPAEVFIHWQPSTQSTRTCQVICEERGFQIHNSCLVPLIHLFFLTGGTPTQAIFTECTIAISQMVYLVIKAVTLKARPRLAGASSSGMVASVRMATVCITRTAFNGYLTKRYKEIMWDLEGLYYLIKSKATTTESNSVKLNCFKKNWQNQREIHHREAIQQDAIHGETSPWFMEKPPYNHLLVPIIRSILKDCSFAVLWTWGPKI